MKEDVRSADTKARRAYRATRRFFGLMAAWPSCVIRRKIMTSRARA
uniref:Uncharacterized protein n=1 Tax=uncultured Armatimonadetes bacterium TaxID=157466 RepID=A0A6J4IFQ7_9BACT|nr:hypothetical protein AVDCRST_MAG63-1834 [uncultured Armatimonadetes bacterium]